MPGYDSPLGSKNFNSNSKMRELDIPDESMQEDKEDISEIEKRIREEREVKRTGKIRLNEGAKKRIEFLIGMLRTTRNVVINNEKYILQSLKDSEKREAIMEVAKYDGTVQATFEMRKQLLARSLVMIAGVDVSAFLGTNDFSAKLEFIDQLDSAFISRLYTEYLLLQEEAKRKYDINSDEEAKEVIEDLKK